MRLKEEDFVFRLPEKVIKETTQCPCHFSCLCYEKEQCEVKSINGKNALLLKSKEKIDCPYQVAFEDGYICQCPTHYAIYADRKKD